MARPHRELEISAEIRASVLPPPPPPVVDAGSVLGDPAFDEAHREYLVSSPHTDFGESLGLEARGPPTASPSARAT